MKRGIQKVVLAIVGFFLWSTSLIAKDTAIAPIIGPAVSSAQDFNRENTKHNLGFSLGFDAQYRFPCSGCNDWSLLTSSSFTSSGKFNFGSTKRKKTGHVGVYQKSHQTFSWNVGLNWSPRPIGRIKFNFFAAPGLYFTRINDLSYVDGNNKELPLPDISHSQFNFGFLFGIGSEVMISRNTSIGMSPRYHVIVSNFNNGSSFQLPIHLKFYF